jgi:DNA-binding NarL/FixJ family response regulator
MSLARDGSSAPAPSCVLADDNEQGLAAVGSYLSAEGVDVLGSARSGVDVLRLLLDLPFIGVVMDPHLPDLGGAALTRRAVEILHRRAATIVYTRRADPGLVRESLDAGARAVVLNDGDPQQLLEALGIVSAGRVYVDPRLRPSRS